MSNTALVAPAGGSSGCKPGGLGKPSLSRGLLPYDVGFALTDGDRRNGWFCAFDDEVPPGEKFQNTPNPPRTSVLPLPLTSYAKPKRGPMSRFEYVCRYRPTLTPSMTALSDATTNWPVETSKLD